MATFPAVTPNSRIFSLGNYPQLEYTGTSGGSVRFLQGSKRVGQRLVFAYVSLSETQTNLIFNHYAGQEGGLIPFDIPVAIWAGYTTVPVSSLDYQWRYVSPPAIETNANNRFSLTIELESVVL